MAKVLVLQHCGYRFERPPLEWSMGFGDSVVGSVPCVRKMAGSNTTLAAM